MKKLLVLFVGMAAITGVSFAAESNQTPVNGNVVAHHDHIWHCTAYDSHGHGFSASDEHRSHAYRAAMNRCEAATHEHCHHVDCHLDH